MSEPVEKKKKVREPKEIVVVKNTYDYQRMKLDRLMKNPVSGSLFKCNVKKEKKKKNYHICLCLIGETHCAAGKGQGPQAS